MGPPRGSSGMPPPGELTGWEELRSGTWLAGGAEHVEDWKENECQFRRASGSARHRSLLSLRGRFYYYLAASLLPSRSPPTQQPQAGGAGFHFHSRLRSIPVQV